MAGLAFLACLAVAQQAVWLTLLLDLLAVETVLDESLQELAVETVLAESLHEVEVLLVSHALPSPACAAEANANTATVSERMNLFILKRTPQLMIGCNEKFSFRLSRNDPVVFGSAPAPVRCQPAPSPVGNQIPASTKRRDRSEAS